jgi:DNA-binding XRE family transcriptional regulator
VSAQPFTLALLTARWDHHETQTVAGARFGLSKQAFGQIELGHRVPPIRLWAPLAAYCDLTPTDLAALLAAQFLDGETAPGSTNPGRGVRRHQPPRFRPS